MFVLILYIFFSLGHKDHRSMNGVSVLLKNVDFSDTNPLNLTVT